MATYSLEKKTDGQLREITDEVVKRALTAKDLKVDKIILYGSYARGDADEESDIDILVLCDNREDFLDKRRYDMNVISSRMSLDYDVEIALTLKDKTVFEKWQDILPFYRNVREEGILLYG